MHGVYSMGCEPFTMLANQSRPEGLSEEQGKRSGECRLALFKEQAP